MDQTQCYPSNNWTRQPGTISSHITSLEARGSPGKKYRCTVCEKDIGRSQYYYHQGCANVEAKKYSCSQCPKRFASKSHLNYHMDVHFTGGFNCSLCGKVMLNSFVLMKHEKHHCKKRVGRLARSESFVKCDLCCTRYVDSADLGKATLHCITSYKCNHCNKFFKRNSSLKMHLEKHLKSSGFNCSICARIFTDYSAMKRHFKTHEDGVLYRCSICDATIARKDNMLRHVRNMHTGQIFQDCVEPQPNEKHKKEPKSDINIQSLVEELNFPKTIENSAVIQYIGNVTPVKVANCCIHQSEYNPIAMYRKILAVD